MAGVADGLSVQSSNVAMYRMYNPYSGEHFYTQSTAERDGLVVVGWRFEGIGWWAPASSASPTYRLYNPYAGDHHYTLSVQERDYLASVGWNYEGIGWYSDDARSAAVYRQYNPYARVGTHNFTTSKSENDHLASVGWNAEGIGWYAVQAGKRYNYDGFTTEQIKAKLTFCNGFRSSFAHGEKSVYDQRFIVLHDTYEWGGGAHVVNNVWGSRSDGVAAHFIVDRDGTVWQCVDLDQVAYHAGAPSDGMAARYGTSNMNARSVGIEISHVPGAERYTEAQLDALDTLIAYIDSYYGFYSTIIDHKMWRAGNPDTSEEFAGYLANYRSFRKHA